MLAPSFAVPLTLVYQGSVDNLTDVEIGFIPFTCKLYRLDIYVDDANATFDATTVTFEIEDDTAEGADTAIEAISVVADTRHTEVANADLSEDDIPANSKVLLTVSNVSTGADTGITAIFWLIPMELR